MNKLERYIGLAILIFTVGFNLWIYRYEPTSKVDPNDNPFQYALVHRTNEMWDFAQKHCPKTPLYPLCFTGYLVDHWVPNWAQGYNLPFYYSHAPQIAIVGSFRLISLINPGMSLFSYYHLVIYLLLCLFPISVFVALRIIKTPWTVAGMGALVAAMISTDGLYGLDPTSFLWRGYGLSSQLFSMPWLPLAIAYSYRFLVDELPILEKPKKTKHVFSTFQYLVYGSYEIIHKTTFLPAILFLVLTVCGHLGIGIIALMSVGILAITPGIVGIFEKLPVQSLVDIGIQSIWKLAALGIATVCILSYWIIPVFLGNNYHNISFWDPVWKFNSWGWKEVVTLFFNGNLFDFGRFPLITILLIIGAFAVFSIHRKSEHRNQKAEEDILTSDFRLPHSQTYIPFAFLFLFWFIMFFGRATWGGLIDLIPGMKEFHQSRFIVGVHLAGFFLAPIGFWFLTNLLSDIVQKAILFLKNLHATINTSDDSTSVPNTQYLLPNAALFLCISVLLTVLFYGITSGQTLAYAKHNDFLLTRGNESYDRQNADVEVLIKTLKALPPGRVFTGRGGSWGKKLELAETQYFMHLSTFGIPVILWLPETWSPNSDVEQFFIDDRAEHYDLLDVKYVVTPPDITPHPFWEFLKETPSWKLYQVKTGGYFGVGSHAAVVATRKETYVNVVRLWLQSDFPKKQLFPQLTFKKSDMVSPLPAFEMTDEATYKLRDGSEHSLFGSVPSYEAPTPNVSITGTENIEQDMIFKTAVTVGENCKQCLVVLKQTAHPNWRAWVNGKQVKPITVFPFYSAVQVSQPGPTTIEFRYQPSTMKLLLLALGTALMILLYVPWLKVLKRLH